MPDADKIAIAFLDRQVPSLPAGAYTLRSGLRVTVASESVTYPSAVEFFVGGERFALAPAEVHSLFPPDGSRGDYRTCLPHVALRCETLPWERSADDDGAPWLALVLLDAAEAARCPLQAMPLGEYRKRFSPPPALEPAQTDDDIVQVLALDDALWARLVPTRAELAALCHVRRSAHNGVWTEGVAVVVSKRVPAEGSWTAHLIALEDRLLADAGGPPIAPSLVRWSFRCEAAAGAVKPGLTRIFQGLDVGWLRVPAPAPQSPAEVHLARGRTALPHRFRSGESGVSWYQGPLVPGRPADDDADLVQLPAECADRLAWYHPDLGMLDVTYAAAWELGRLLALQHRGVAAALAELRRQQLYALRRREQAAHDHLPQLQRASDPDPGARELLGGWIRDLWRLVGIPFKYLVADERMLPTESLRFFTVDPRWIAALLDGAFGLARLPGAKTTRSPLEEALLHDNRGPAAISGFLLRSEATSGWPDLAVDAYDGDDRPIEVYPTVRLSPSIGLHVFAGQVASIALRQHPNTIHLEVREPIAWADEGARVLAIDPNRPSAELARDLLARG